MPGEYAFEIDSNVGRYWLANGEGFDVVVERGRRVGVVEDVVVNPVTHEVSSVVVRRPLSAGVRRPAQVPIDDLTAVLPASRRFLVAPDVPALTRHERRDRLRAATRAALAYAYAKWPTVRRRLGVAASWTAHALTTAAVLIAAFIEWCWRTGRERLRESERNAHSRARRTR